MLGPGGRAWWAAREKGRPRALRVGRQAGRAADVPGAEMVWRRGAGVGGGHAWRPQGCPPVISSIKKDDLCLVRSKSFSTGTGSNTGKGKGPVTWKSVGITACIGGGLLMYMQYLKAAKEQKILRERQRALGKASIGGHFELTDHNKKKRKSDEFLGQWILIYFGFTHCPDVCPDELEKIVAVVNKLDQDSSVPKIQPIFITVDPVRDTPEVVGQYIKEFSPKLIGLTGNVEEVEKVCRAYRVYFSAGPRDRDDDYIVDHTIITYLVNPDGQFVDYYGQTKKVDEICDSILINIAKYGQLQSSWF
ncbi:SCO1-like protein, mitochondrial [Gryllus bimaculatus]|nr:SCO1-like protein, mitochondrial [Gryllus bimaculatus]